MDKPHGRWAAQDRQKSVRVARERLLAGSPDHPADGGLVPEDIATSWRRSLRYGVAPDSSDVPYDDSAPTPHRLLDAALPVVDRLASQLTDSSTILLASADAQIVERWACRSFLRTLDRFHVAPGFVYAEHRVGTNGLGCALEEKRLFQVHGPEHFRECLQTLVCVAAPITLPTTKVVQGALNVTCTVREANALLGPLVQQTIAEIERRLLEAVSARERLLLDAFLSRARRSSHAVLAQGSDFVMANAVADRLVPAADRMILWHWASDALRGRETARCTISLGEFDEVSVTATKVGEGAGVLGVVFELRPRTVPAHRRSGGLEVPPGAVAGRSPAARNLRQAIARALDDPAPLVVTGPHGSGRAFIACAVATKGWEGGNPPLVVSELPDRAGPIVPEGVRVLIVRDVQSCTSPNDLRCLLQRARARGVRVVATAADSADAAAHVQQFGSRIEVPPLSARREDIPDLAAELLAELSVGPPPVLDPAAMRALLRHDWPGNVLELRAVLSVAAATARNSQVSVFHLPQALRELEDARRWSPLELAERNAIVRALRDHEGNKVAAAEALGLARSTLYRRLRALDIEVT